MSVEYLLKEFPADKDLSLFMEATKAVLGAEKEGMAPLRERSKIAVLAQEYIRAGQMGLKEILKNYNSRRRPPLHIELRTQIETAAVFLGGTILEIEAGLQTEVMDMFGLVNNVNSALTATPLQQGCRIPEDSTIILTTGEWRQMVSCLKEDPTFSLFFTKPGFLPAALWSYLEKEKVYGDSFLNCIKRDLLTDYKNRANLLIPEKSPPASIKLGI